MIKNIALGLGAVGVSLLIATGVVFGQTTSPTPTVSPSPTPTVPAAAPSTGHG